MSVSVVLPFIVAVIATYVVNVLHRGLPPRLTAWLLTLVGCATALSGAWLVVTLSLAFLGQNRSLDRWLGWCDDVLSSHDIVPAPIGVAAIVAAVLMSTAAIRTYVRYRNAWALGSGDDTEIVDDPRLIAHAIPGRRNGRGTIVVSSGMITTLDSDELEAVVAHERSHLAHKHHRFLALVDVAASAVPLLRPLRSHIRLATERWADEDAAVAVGSRHVVASAVARAALAEAAGAYAMAMSGGSTVVRVHALVHESGGWSRLKTVTVGWAAVMATGALLATTVQVHHTLGLFTHLCN